MEQDLVGFGSLCTQTPNSLKTYSLAELLHLQYQYFLHLAKQIQSILYSLFLFWRLPIIDPPQSCQWILVPIWWVLNLFSYGNLECHHCRNSFGKLYQEIISRLMMLQIWPGCWLLSLVGIQTCWGP